MRRMWITRSLALLAALALCLPAALAEELGELDLYDPLIYAGEELPPDGTTGEETAPETPVPEAPLIEDTAGETPAGATGEATPVPEAAPAEDSAAATPVDPDATAPDAMPATDAADPAAAPDALVDPAANPEAAADPAADPDMIIDPTVDPDALVDPATDPALEPLMAEPDAEVAAPDAADLRLGLGEQYPLDGAALLGGEIPAQYISELPEIASVDAAGLITANALGTTRIAVIGASGATAVRTVAVLGAPEKLLFPADTLELGKGERRAWAASLPQGTASAQITYASSKPKVLQVDAAGNLVAKKAGTVLLTATAYNGAKATCAVRVGKAPSRVTLSAKSLALCVGESRALKATLPNKSVSPIQWTSGNPGVVAVDAAGNLAGVAAGTATVTAQTFNGKKASCKVVVLDGAPPTALTLNATALSLGAKETFRLVPSVGAGEAAVYAYKTSAKKVATVGADGLVTAKKAGTAVITVATHNGLTATVRVTVSKAPGKVTVSPARLQLAVGQTGQLSAALPAGTASAITWESSDPAVATVDAGGLVTALSPGTAAIRVRTFNNKTALCWLNVVAEGSEDISLPDSDASGVADLSAAQMAANLRKSSALGGKRDAIANVVQLLVNDGFEPAFAAGVGANIYAEGTYGLFESSKYIKNYQKRPRYFCYLDGGNYYALSNGRYELSAVYLSQEELDAYDGKAEKKLRFAEKNFYLDNYSGKYAQNVDLDKLEALMEALAAGKWQGKFGLGIVQWTGARTASLVALYRKHAGSSNRLTAAQVVAAENEMILNDFRGGYKGVYTSWVNANRDDLRTADAARSAGALVCTKYEIPVNKESKAVTRGNKAAEIYKIMMGL